ncbi:hypothetical protein GGH96_001129 [Coemansia sp. RSA 1972]|nr:hypothetical protein GGH96_001129 [Coemansia sp. RSA 1972]
MLTAYSNNVMLHFNNTWRQVVNVLLDCKQRRSALRQKRKAEGATPAMIRREREAQIWGPARRFKEALGTGQPDAMSKREDEIIDLQCPVYQSYSIGYQFQMDSIYYDSKANPLKHLQAFVHLNAVLVGQEKKCTQALPLRHSWVYSHVPLNTCILAQCVLRQTYQRPLGGKDNIEPDIKKYWGQAVDLNRQMFRPHEQHLFKGVAYTDGVSISAVREMIKVKPTKSKASKKRKRVEPEQPQQPQSVAQRAQLAAQPMAQSSQQTVPLYQPVQEEQQLWTHVVQQVHEAWAARQAQLSVEQAWQECLSAEHAWQVLLSTQPAQQQRPPAQQPSQEQNTEPVQLEQQADCTYISDLSQATLQGMTGRCVLVDPGRRDLLYMMHEKSTVAEKQVYRYTRSQQRKETRVTKHQKIREHEKKADKEDIAALERTLSAGSYIKPDLTLFEVYLKARAEVETELTRFYNRTMCRQRVSATTPKVPLHRKLRLSAFVNRQQADQLLVNRLQAKFKPEESDPEPIFIMGNWSAPTTQFHEPIRGKGWRTLLKRSGFDVYLIDEYLTSKTCPNCFGQLSNTHYVPNPRPFQRRNRPEVKCHRLLGCQSQICMEFFKTYEGDYLGKEEGEKKDKIEGKFHRKLWNRDLAAVLNFRHILFSLQETGTVPTRFQWGQQPIKTPWPPQTRRALKTRKTPTASTAPPNPTNPTTIPSS